MVLGVFVMLNKDIDYHFQGWSFVMNVSAVGIGEKV